MADEVQDMPINGEPAAAAAATIDPLAWDPILILTKPIKLGSEEIKELKFREPKGKDIEEIGMPVIPGTWPPRWDAEVMGQMMAKLAGVPPSTIKALHSRDWTTGAYKIWNFFIPAPK